MAENQPGLGRGSGGNNDRAGSVTAGFKVDTKSLDNLNKLWERLVQNVRNFNAELRKIDGKALDRMSLGMGGIPGMGRGMGGHLSPGQFSSPITGMGRTPSGLILPNGGIPPVKTAGGTQQPAGNGGDSRFSGGRIAGATALAGVGAAGAYASSHRDNMVNAERLAQLTAWGTAGSAGGTNDVMGQARHFWFGGNGQQGLTGYTSQADMFSGLQTIRERQGLSMSASSQSLQQQAARAGNLLGSMDQGAQATTGFYSPSAYYKMMPLGIKTIGSGGAKLSQEQISEQLLKRIYGGRMPTAEALNEGRAEGSNMRATMNSLGLDASTQEFVYSYGETAAKMGGAGSGRMAGVLSKTGGAPGQLGDTVFDADRRKAQAKARIEQELADGALPALRAQVDATTAAFKSLNGILGGGVGSALGVGAIGGGAVMGGVGGVMGMGGGLLGQYAMTRLALRAGGAGGLGGLGRMGAGLGARAGAIGGLGRLGGAGALAAGGLIGGSAINSAVSSTGHSTLGRVAGRAATGASIGAGLGMLGGPFAPLTVGAGAGFGALAGGALGLFEGMGGAGGPSGGTGSVEEVDAVSAGLDRVIIPTAPVAPGGSNAGADVGNLATDATGAAPGSPGSGMPGSSASSAVSSGTATRRGASALAWMARESRNGSQNWFNRCLVDVRTSLGVGAKYGTASIGWANTKKRRGTGTPPPGVPVWWTGGAGHVALSAGGGMVWSNDILRYGKIDKVSIDYINRKWHKPYHGWTEDINDVVVYNSSSGGSGGSVRPGASGGVSTAKAGSAPQSGDPRAYAKSRMAAYGWGANQWASLDTLWQHESNWKSSAQNPTSTAYGIAQFLNSTWSGTGYKKSSDPHVQIDAGMKYIKSRYGTPAIAWNKWQARSPHWYKDGAWNVQGDQLAMIHHGEMVVPVASANRMRDYVRRGNEGTGGSTPAPMQGPRSVVVHLSMPIQMTNGTAADAQRFAGVVASKLESDVRIAAVMRGD